MKILILFIALTFSLNSFAKSDKEIDFLNNMELLSNDFKEYKGVKLSWGDERIIKSECSELTSKDPALHSKCIIFYQKLALSFKVDALICKNKAKRISNANKNRSLTLLDEDGKVKIFTIKDVQFSKTVQYEKCMDIMKWKDPSNFRYGRIK